MRLHEFLDWNYGTDGDDQLARMMLEAGAPLHHPGVPQDDAYLKCLLEFASPRVAEVLRAAR